MIPGGIGFEDMKLLVHKSKLVLME